MTGCQHTWQREYRRDDEPGDLPGCMPCSDVLTKRRLGLVEHTTHGATRQGAHAQVGSERVADGSRGFGVSHRPADRDGDAVMFAVSVRAVVGMSACPKSAA